MKAYLLLFVSILFIGNTFGQKEKIKGNKITTTEQRDVSAFHTIKIFDNFEVSLSEDSDNIVKIETDSNLHEFIKTEVQDSTLTISTSKNFKSFKNLNLKILYASSLKKVVIHDKVEIKSISPIQSPVFSLQTNDNTETFLTINSDKLNYTSNGKSKVELHTTSKEVIYQINDNSKLKGILSADNGKINVFKKGFVKLEGNLKSLIIKVTEDANFYGEKLESIKTDLTADGSSDCFMLTTEEITINAKDKTEIYLLGDAKINLETFSNESILYKKDIDYSPSRLRL